MDPALKKTMVEEPLERVRESAVGEHEGLEKEAGPATHSKASQEADPVHDSSPERALIRGGSPAPRGSSKGPRRGKPEVPELDGAPQRKARQHPEEGDPIEVVDGPVSPREAAIVEGEVTQNALTPDINSAETEQTDVPGRSRARFRGRRGRPTKGPGGGSLATRPDMLEALAREDTALQLRLLQRSASHL